MIQDGFVLSLSHVYQKDAFFDIASCPSDRALLSLADKYNLLVDYIRND